AKKSRTFFDELRAESSANDRSPTHCCALARLQTRTNPIVSHNRFIGVFFIRFKSAMPGFTTLEQPVIFPKQPFKRQTRGYRYEQPYEIYKRTFARVSFLNGLVRRILEQRSNQRVCVCRKPECSLVLNSQLCQPVHIGVYVVCCSIECNNFELTFIGSCRTHSPNDKLVFSGRQPIETRFETIPAFE